MSHSFVLYLHYVSFICSIPPLCVIHLFYTSIMCHSFVLYLHYVSFICSIPPLCVIHLFYTSIMCHSFVLYLHYSTLVYRDEGGVKTRSVTTTEKLETFVSHLEGVFINEIENNVFDEEVKTDVDAELDKPVARVRLNFQKVIHFDQDIHHAESGSSTRVPHSGKPVTRTVSPTKSYAIFYPHFISFFRT